MTTPIVLTDEIRQAVRDEDCTRDGHLPTLPNATAWEPAPRVPAGQLPHVRCARCNRVWIMLPDSEVGYQAAETRLHARLKTDDPIVVAGPRVPDAPTP